MPRIENKQIITLFPSLIFKGQVDDMSLIDDAERKVRMLRTMNKGSHSDSKHFISSDMLQDEPDFVDVSNLIMQEAEAVLDFFNVARDSHYISNMWANITSTNHRHMLHVHPNTFLSGILYLKTPEKCGPTVFTDPRPAARVFEPNYSEMNETNAGVFIHPATKGEMLMWNSWLPHGVEKGYNENHEDRIVIAFNVMIKATIVTPTSRLVI